MVRNMMKEKPHERVPENVPNKNVAHSKIVISIVGIGSVLDKAK